MSDPAVRLALSETCTVGVMFALLAWLLHFVTSFDEPEHFSFFPPNELAWSGYWIRTALLITLGLMFLSSVRHMPSFVGTALMYSVLALAYSSFSLIHLRHGSCIFGFVLCAGWLISMFLSPVLVE